MDAMSRTREQILHDAIREADDRERATEHAIHVMLRAADHCQKIERELARSRIAFWIAAIAGGVGWLWVWALLAWGWIR